MTTLKFKTEAEFLKWQKSLPEKPKLRVAASLGERVVADATGVLVPRSKSLPPWSPGREKVRRAAAWLCLTTVYAGLWGASTCLTALWVLSAAGRH